MSPPPNGLSPHLPLIGLVLQRPRDRPPADRSTVIGKDTAARSFSSAPPTLELLGEPRLSCLAHFLGTPPTLPARRFLHHRPVSHREALHYAALGARVVTVLDAHVRASALGRFGRWARPRPQSLGPISTH
jgi:hypothetical protein